MANQNPYLQLQAGFGVAPKSVTAGSLTSEGVIQVAIDAQPPSGGVLVLANGVTLRGVLMTENNMSINVTSDVICTSLFVRCPSGSATLAHNDSGVTDTKNRLWIERSNADLTVTPGQLVHLLYDSGAQRWGVYSIDVAIADAAPVQSVNSQTGAVVLDASDVGADASGTATGAVSAHVAASDPHPQYTTASEAAAAAPVQSVNGSIGTVTLDATDVGADASGTAAAAIASHVGASDPHSQYTTAAEAAAAAPVQSVNGDVGAVDLDATDVGADPAGTAASAVASHVSATNPHSQYTRSLRYSGTTSGSGTYSATFSSAFSSTPNVQANIIGGTVNQFVVVTSRSTTGFTVTTYGRAVLSVLGLDVLAGTATTVNGLTVDVLVTSNG